MGPITRAFDATIEDVDMVRRSVVARINTASRDRYNTVILPRGCQSKGWRASGGPVLWEHGKHPVRFTDPIANGDKLWNNGGPQPTELIAEPVFLKDDFAQERLEWYRDGKVKGWSVNILPVARSAGPPTKDELRSRPDWEGVESVYREWELAEFSGTVLPGNIEALTADRASQVMELVQRGLWLPDGAKELYEAALTRNTHVEGKMCPAGKCPMCDKARAAGERSVSRYITHSGDKWIVHAESGKVLGEYASEGEAKKRLEQIEYFKHKDASGERHIVTDGHQSWTICEPDGTPIDGLEFSDAQTAERCLRAMQVPVAWTDIHGSVADYQEVRNQQITADVQAMLDLVLRGVV
jgi:hypothetical protein